MSAIRRSRRRHHDGQAIMEFALLFPVLMLLMCAVVDYGLYWVARVDTAQAARDGARFAALYPTNWSHVNPPAPNTIESQILTELAAPASWSNTDSNITISYWDTSTSPNTECGYYSVASSGFVAMGAYTQASCVKSGNQITVALANHYAPLTPLAHDLFGPIPGGIPLNESSSIIEGS